MAGLALIATAVAVADSTPKPEAQTFRIGEAAHEPACPGSRSGLSFWRRSYAHWRALSELPGPPRLVRYLCDATRVRASLWRLRAASAWRAYVAWKHDQYAWARWLPAKWFRVARCETGVNWSHDSGAYVSAFGIERANYARDAAWAGDLSWDETVRRRGRVPTPRKQYDAALQHYRHHGGFSGWGCRGA